MNAYKLNGMARHYLRTTISNYLGIHFMDIYKTIGDIDKNNIIWLKDGRKFKLTLEEIN